jgi:predicted transcriptional regulator of viral defense system
LELTLLDICRYFHKAAGINGAAQAVHDLGKYVNPRFLAKAASAYESSAVRRLGYLLEHFGHNLQAQALKFFAMKAKSFKALDLAVKPMVPELGVLDEKNQDWKLIINVPIEIEA